MTYARLRQSSDELATRLVRGGVRRGTPVGVCGQRSLEALVGLLGILKAGLLRAPGRRPAARQAAGHGRGRGRADHRGPAGQHLPPAERQGPCAPAAAGGGRPDRADTAGATEHGRDADGIPGSARPPVPGDARDCAYVMFTSGSSGRPKPVAVPHRAVVRLALSEPELPPPGADDVVLHGYALSSDASTIEIWNALLGGARLELVDREELVSPPALAERLRGITVAYLTTSVFHHMARSAPQALSGLRFVSAGGEAMDPHLARAVLAACPHTTVVNFYGPTENAVVSTFHRVRGLPDDATTVPIGRPYGASVCHVLRPDGTEAADGETGELALGGDGLALGYVNDTRLTAQRFVYLPRTACRRLYRTGDHVARRSDGVLEYRGARTASSKSAVTAWSPTRSRPTSGPTPRWGRPSSSRRRTAACCTRSSPRPPPAARPRRTRCAGTVPSGCPRR
ncbi:Amino acid adenylation domain-containing protein OS=Streptomyces alboniger OX=132473 GN=CP975_33870 PE=4 SV=1 [Streptomyces alboniger]